MYSAIPGPDASDAIAALNKISEGHNVSLIGCNTLLISLTVRFCLDQGTVARTVRRIVREIRCVKFGIHADCGLSGGPVPGHVRMYCFPDSTFV